jgi:aspartate racemase
MEKLIGLIGGLGPLAGADVLQKLFVYAAQQYGAVKDSDYPNVLLLSRGLEDFDETGSISPEFEKTMVSIMEELEQHQPTLVGIACNTAHSAIPAMQKKTNARFIHMIEETAKEASSIDRTYLVLSSSTTRKQGLYHEQLDKYSVKYIDATDEQQKEVDRLIHLVMSGDVKEANNQAMRFAEAAMRANSEITGLIAGCTELPIAFGTVADEGIVPVVSSNNCLAKALADAYYDSSSKNSAAQTIPGSLR